MAPSLGRVVIYTQLKGENLHNGHADHPAIITRVWSPECVNLKVLFDCGPVEDQTSVVRKDEAHQHGVRSWPEKIGES